MLRLLNDSEEASRENWLQAYMTGELKKNTWYILVQIVKYNGWLSTYNVELYLSTA